MALVTVQRSPTGNSPNNSDSGGSLDDEEKNKNGKSLSECYFANKGAAMVLGAAQDRPAPAACLHSQARPPDIQHHLQTMFYLLSPEETLKMAVKLESVHPSRTRYLVVVSRPGRQLTEESCLLGIDCNHATTVGLVLRVLADTSITLDGDGGFSVSVAGRTHIFKPVSVQAMWSALQTLHKVSAKARCHNYFLGGVSHDWVEHYEANISSDQSCLNEWHAMDSIESRRPPSPDSIRHKPIEREETEKVIRSSLKEIMMSVDLDEVTSKQVRAKLEESLDVDLTEYKPFIDEEMLVILGQMDEATQIFPHVYLGSEWNASNLEELTKNGVCHILNVTREIDNFFPGMFDYLNIRVYDDEKTDLLKHWDHTFKYITKAKKSGSKVLVHCKMGVSRSASVVIAYAMKAYSWDLKKAISYVQNKRNCIKPNSSFIQQLETYQGILDAMKNREKLQRSKSETNLKCNGECVRGNNIEERSRSESEARVPPLHPCEQVSGPTTSARANSPTSSLIVPPPPLFPLSSSLHPHSRPKSWSPDHATANNIFTTANGRLRECEPTSVPPPPPPLPPPPPTPPPLRNISACVRMPCPNGLAYSVSQNKIIHLPTLYSGEDTVSTVRLRVTELEGGRSRDRKGLVLNLTNQFEECLGGKSTGDAIVVQIEGDEGSVSGGGSGVSRGSSWGSGDSRSSGNRASPEPGIVKSLKKEFEAKSRGNGGVGGGSSLPSSPVSERSGPATASLEDLTVRRLVNKHKPPKPPSSSTSPAVVVAASLNKAAQHKKQQQGKTHPLARLTRHTNPVYNTM